jgi:nucleoside-diphosphate-sugar epimerase
MTTQNSKVKKILLLGGAGFLGSNISITLIRAGFDVFIIDSNCDRIRTDQNLDGISGFYEGNASDVESVLKFVDSCLIDCVVNLISTLGPSSKLTDFAYQVSSNTLPGFHIIPSLADRG